jgi:hypothetical protein
MISTGVALASRGELHFHLGGFLVQAGAVLVSLLPLSLSPSNSPIHTRSLNPPV